MNSCSSIGASSGTVAGAFDTLSLFEDPGAPPDARAASCPDAWPWRPCDGFDPGPGSPEEVSGGMFGDEPPGSYPSGPTDTAPAIDRWDPIAAQRALAIELLLFQLQQDLDEMRYRSTLAAAHAIRV
jgi:hypothetical protein